jgi:pimeloyl-ACP methyl ester carboxylesterase
MARSGGWAEAPAHATLKQTANPMQQPTLNTTRVETGRALVNGIRIYCDIRGRHDRVPLVLLHGGGSTIASNLNRIPPLLASTRRVVAL